MTILFSNLEGIYSTKKEAMIEVAQQTMKNRPIYV